MAGTSGGMVVRIAGNIDDLKKALEEGTLVIQRTMSAAEKLSKSFSGDKLIAAANASVDAINRVGVSALNAAETARELDKLERAMEKLRLTSREIPPEMQATADKLRAMHGEFDRATQKTSLFGDAVKKIGPMVVAAFSIGAIKSFASSLLDTADGLAKMSDKTGISAEGLQDLQAAAIAGGNTIDDVAKAVNKMQVGLAGEDKGVVKALGAVGLSLDTLRGMKPEDQFTTIATAIQKVEDPADRAKLRVELFGKAGNEIAGTLNQDFASISSGVTKMSNDTVAKLDAAGDSLEQMTQNIKATLANWLVSAHSGIVTVTSGVIVTWMQLRVAWLETMESMNLSLSKLTEAGGDRWKKLRTEAAGFHNEAERGKEAIAIYVSQMQTGMDKSATSTKRASTALLGLGESASKAAKPAKDTADAITQVVTATKLLVPQFVMLNGQLVQIDQNAKNTAKNFEFLGWAIEGVEQINFGTVTLPPVIKGLGDTAKAAADAGDAIADKLGSVMRNLPQTMRSAFEGGGGLGGALKSIGVQVGDAIAGSILDEMSKKLAAGLKQLFNGGGLSALGSVASAAAPIAIWTTILSGWQAAWNNYQQWKAEMAAEAAAAALAAAEWRVELNKLNSTYDTLLGKIQSQLVPLENIPGLNSRSRAELERQIPILEKILATEEEIASKEAEYAALKESLIPTWQDVEAAVRKYGLSVDGAGQRIQQLKVTTESTSLIDDWEMLQRAGWDTTSMLDGMKEELSAMAQQAMQYGVELPAQMQPMLQALSDQGLLTDANGGKLKDLTGIKFGAPVKTEADKIKEAMEKIDLTIATLKESLEKLVESINKLVKPSEDAASAVYRHWQKPPWADWGSPDFPDPNGNGGTDPYAPNAPGPPLPQYSQGTGGRFVDFGSGTQVMLHGRERVVTERETTTSGQVSVFSTAALEQKLDSLIASAQAQPRMLRDLILTTVRP
jgi:hypothetical protein